MQFDRALKRVLQRIYKANSKFGHVYLSKIDISDGFYRIVMSTEDAAKLAVLFSTRDGEPPLVGSLSTFLLCCCRKNMRRGQG